MEPTLKTETAIARTSLADSVYETLLEAVLSGQLPSGTELKSVAIAEQLDVSRTPVQEALRRLAADGLVEWSMGRKARVSSFSRDDVIEIYSLRRLLEGEAALRAATRISSEQLTDLTERATNLDENSGLLDWNVQALDYDIHFHNVVAEACGNRRLRLDIERYRMLVRAFCRMVGSADNLKAALREHREILEALQRRDAEASRARMVSHIDARLQTVLFELFGEPTKT